MKLLPWRNSRLPVIWTRLLAEITAKKPLANLRAQRQRNGPFVFYGEIRNTQTGIKLTGAHECRRWAHPPTTKAFTTSAFVRLVRLELQICKQLCHKVI